MKSESEKDEKRKELEGCFGKIGGGGNAEKGLMAFALKNGTPYVVATNKKRFENKV
jgi:hypothetical protein